MTLSESGFCDLLFRRDLWQQGGICLAIALTKRAAESRSAGLPLFLPKDKASEEGSFAACFAGEKVPGRPRLVPAHLWIDSAGPDSTIRLCERFAMQDHTGRPSNEWKVRDH